MQSYELFSYDVYGNETDGYEVNNVYRIGILELPENPTDEQIHRVLLDREFLNMLTKVSDLSFEGESEFTLYVSRSRDAYPLCELRRR